MLLLVRICWPFQRPHLFNEAPNQFFIIKHGIRNAMIEISNDATQLFHIIQQDTFMVGGIHFSS